MKETVEEQNGVETSPETAPAAPLDLNLQDLVAMHSLIDIVTQRGAFKANELSGVGMLFDKLSAFLNAAQKQQAEKEAAKGE